MSTLYNSLHMREPRDVFDEGITREEYLRLAEGIPQPFADVPVITPTHDARIHDSATEAVNIGGLSRVPLTGGTVQVEYVTKGF